MRPRHKAAENPGQRAQARCLLLASMRPRHKAAENDVVVNTWPRRIVASMRPRHKAAENRSRRGDRRGRMRGFNEAAA